MAGACRRCSRPHCRPARRTVADPQRRANSLGTPRALQPGPMVAALAELDARVVACASGRPHARDFTRAVPLGWSDARSWRRIAGAARVDSFLFVLQPELSGFFHLPIPTPPSFSISLFLASPIILGTDTPSILDLL